MFRFPRAETFSIFRYELINGNGKNVTLEIRRYILRIYYVTNKNGGGTGSANNESVCL